MAHNQRIIVKIGSSSLTSDEGGLNRAHIEFFARELARLHRTGAQVLLVTSGAVAAGFPQVGYAARPRVVHEKQAAAAVGQALLMQAYQQAFASHEVTVAQLLLTRHDFADRQRIHNAQRTIEELLRMNVLPIINENDTVATDELKFGDNDTLSALVSNVVKASQLIIVTDTDGLYTADPRSNPDAIRIERVEHITPEILALAGGSGSSVGTGGMRSKIEAARIAMRGGIPAFIGRVMQGGDLLQAVNGSGRGTYFEPSTPDNLPMKKQWLGFHSPSNGRIIVDDGAANALRTAGKSLLPAGICGTEGDYHSGDVVDVFDRDGQRIGRGVTNYEAWQVKAAQGLSSDEVKLRLDVPRIEVIHRDEWITL